MRSPSELQARWVSSEVLGQVKSGPVSGALTARFDATLHAEVDGFVVAVLPPGAPRLPNGLAVAAAFGDHRVPAVGDPVVLSGRGLTLGGVTIAWDDDPPPRWDPRLRRWNPARRGALAGRARRILGTGRGASPEAVAAEALAGIEGLRGDDASARQGLDSLLASVRSRDRRRAAGAAAALAGRGEGLTPVGDDVLAATALTVTAAGTAAGWSPRRRRAWLSALAPPDLRERTTAFSATMLELAIRGRGMAPVQTLLDPLPISPRSLAAGLARVRRVGHTTGPAYAAAIGAVALTLADTAAQAKDQPEKEETR